MLALRFVGHVCVVAGDRLERDPARRGATIPDVREVSCVEPQSIELVINMKIAKAIGLTIAPSLLLRADHVIE
jgi:hypothetical protein